MDEPRGRGPHVGRARKSGIIPRGQAHIQATFNNTVITLTDRRATPSAGQRRDSWFQRSRKSTPYAAQVAAQQAARLAQENGMREVDIYIKGPGPGREAAIRSLQSAGLMVRSITDMTPIPHNGAPT